MDGKLLGIAWKAESRGPVMTGTKRRISLSAGVEGDFRGKPGNRQVTVLAREAFDAACAELGAQYDWKLRRANLLIEDIELVNSEGRKLRIGNVLLEITGETLPCQRMDEQLDGLTLALKPDWRGGVCCRVLEEGEIAVGDVVVIE